MLVRLAPSRPTSLFALPSKRSPASHTREKDALYCVRSMPVEVGDLDQVHGKDQPAGRAVSGDGRDSLRRFGQRGSVARPIRREQSAEQTGCTESINRLAWEPVRGRPAGRHSGDLFADPLRLGYEVGGTHHRQTVVVTQLKFGGSQVKLINRSHRPLVMGQFPSGGEGTRTLGLRLAKPPLFQLSYTPG